MAKPPPPEVEEALKTLGVRKLVFSVQDPSFPPGRDDDVGRGTPYSTGGLALLEFVRSLGFDAVQLGPQGQTSRGNPSPYDGAIFARNTVSLGLAALTFGRRRPALLRRRTLHALVRSTPREDAAARYRHAYDASRLALAECYDRYRSGLAGGAPEARALADELAAFRARHAAWLVPYGLYGLLEARHGGAAHDSWPAAEAELYADGSEERAKKRALLAARAEPELEAYALGQLLAHEQHRSLRDTLRPMGLSLYGDLQIGLSKADVWARRALLLNEYLMGAPPSRTNPDGQPWGYAVLDPEKLDGPDGEAGPALAFHIARVEKMLSEYDGLRLDHPHGIVCPWVYRAGDRDPLHAVQNGARLRSSPGLVDHPELAPFAIAQSHQIDHGLPRYADGWVRWLDEDQVARYARVFDAIADALGRAELPERLVCEVLSTQPYPLARVMDRHGLGRFRVTQKANLSDPADVYRAENARPEDWIMVANHDTPPIWGLATDWHDTPEGDAQAAHLASVLRPTGNREALFRAIRRDPGALVHAKIAELFVSPAAHVLVFFADLFGMRGVYNRPGVVSDDNWSLRLPADFERGYERAVAVGAALDLPCALALALRARCPMRVDLIARLEALARFRVEA